jgi:hypothetical protein
MPAPNSWNDVRPGDVVTYTKVVWSRSNQQEETITRRLRVSKVDPGRDPDSRTLEGVALTSKGAPHKTLNTRPMKHGMGHVAVLTLDRIVSVRTGART